MMLNGSAGELRETVIKMDRSLVNNTRLIETLIASGAVSRETVDAARKLVEGSIP